MSTRRRLRSPTSKPVPVTFTLPLPCDVYGATLTGVAVTRAEPPANPSALRVNAGYSRVRIAAYAHVDLDTVELYELDRASAALSAAERYRLDCTYTALWGVALAITRAIDIPPSERAPRWPLHAADPNTANRSAAVGGNAGPGESAP